MELPGKRKRGRPKRKFMDVVKEDMAEVEVTEEDTVDRRNWRKKIRCGDPWWEKPKEEEEEGRKEGTYLFDQTTIVNTIHIYENAMVRRLSLRLNIAASATATEIIIIII